MMKRLLLLLILPVLVLGQSLSLDMNGRYFNFFRATESTFIPDDFTGFMSLSPDSPGDTSQTGAVYSSGDYAYSQLKMFYYPAGRLDWGFELENEHYEGYSTYDRFFAHLQLNTDSGSRVYYTENHSEYIFRGLMSHPLYPTYDIKVRQGGIHHQSRLNRFNIVFKETDFSGTGMDSGTNTDNQDFQWTMNDTISRGLWFLAGKFEHSGSWQDTVSSITDRMGVFAGRSALSLGAELLNGSPEWVFRSEINFSLISMEFGRTVDLISLRTRLITGMDNSYYSYYYGSIYGKYTKGRATLSCRNDLKWIPAMAELLYSVNADSLILQDQSPALQNRTTVEALLQYRFLTIDNSMALTLFNGYHLAAYYPDIFEWKLRLTGHIHMFDNHLLLEPMIQNHLGLQADYGDIWFSPELLRYLPTYETSGQLQWNQWINAGISATVGSFDLEFMMDNVFQQAVYSVVNQTYNTRFFRLNIRWNWIN